MKECTRTCKNTSPQKESTTTYKKGFQPKRIRSNWQLKIIRFMEAHKEVLNLTTSRTSSKNLSTPLKILLFFSSHTPHKIAKQHAYHNTLNLPLHEWESTSNLLDQRGTVLVMHPHHSRRTKALTRKNNILDLW